MNDVIFLVDAIRQQAAQPSTALQMYINQLL